MRKIFGFILIIYSVFGLSVGYAAEKENNTKVSEATAQDILDKISDIIKSNDKVSDDNAQDVQQVEYNEPARYNGHFFVGLEMPLLSKLTQKVRYKSYANTDKTTLSKFNSDVFEDVNFNFGVENENAGRLFFVLSHTDVRFNTNGIKSDEVNKSLYGIKLDCFFGPYKETKPFVRFAAAYASMEINDADFGGAVVGLGLGLNHKVSDSVSMYLSAGYSFFAEREIADTGIYYTENLLSAVFGLTYKF